jgi:lysyl oxidase/WD40 repeat protein
VTSYFAAMGSRAIVLACLAALLALLPAHAATAPAVERLVVVERGDVHVVDPAGKASPKHLTRTPQAESEPAVSPDGKLLALVREGRVVVVPAAGGTPRRLEPPATSPSFSPDGKQLVVAAAGGLTVVTLSTGAGRPLLGTEGAARPAWSPDGSRIAFERAGDVWSLALADGAATQLTDSPAADGEPAWSPGSSSIAFVSDRDGNRELYVMPPDGSAETRLTTHPADDSSPAFSPSGRLAFVREGTVMVATASGGSPTRVTTGADPAWARVAAPQPKPRSRPKPKPKPVPRDELLPDLDQRAPSGLSVMVSRGRFLLGFTSATDNVGTGPLWIRASRPSRKVPLMTANQLVVLKNGRVRVVRDVGRVRYTISPPHYHWHLLRFQSYELRRADDFALVVRDRKSGFCLADHYGTARQRVPNFKGPRFLGNCGSFRRDLLSVEQGTSVGYTDRYPAYFHGQNVDVTRVPAGIYVLVHRANPNRRIHERTLANNAASVRLHLSWPNGMQSTPRIQVLRTCEGSENCRARGL